MQLLELKDSKEDVYGTLDAWVAWEQNFPIASLKNALLALEKEQQWHRVVQVRGKISLSMCWVCVHAFFSPMFYVPTNLSMLVHQLGI